MLSFGLCKGYHITSVNISSCSFQFSIHRKRPGQIRNKAVHCATTYLYPASEYPFLCRCATRSPHEYFCYFYVITQETCSLIEQLQSLVVIVILCHQQNRKSFISTFASVTKVYTSFTMVDQL